MAPCKLLAALEEAGLDDELNLIQYELDMDADANDDENEEHEEAEQLGSRDSEDDIGKANTSSTVQNTPTLSHPATRKWKFSTKSNEQDDDGACMHSQFQDCLHKYCICNTFQAFKDHHIHSIYYKPLGRQENCVRTHPCWLTA